MSADRTLQIICRWSFKSVKSLCMFGITHSMLLSLSSVAFYIAFNLSSSLFAMSATVVMCFTSKAAVKVVLWTASSTIVPVGSWTTWVLSFLPVLFFFVVGFSMFLVLIDAASSQSLRLRTSCWPWGLDLMWLHSPVLHSLLRFVASRSRMIHQCSYSPTRSSFSWTQPTPL